MDPTTNGKADEKPITHVDVPDDSASADGEGAAGSGTSDTAKPSLADLATAGLTPGEIDMAKAQGLVEDPDKKDDKPDEKKTVTDDKKEGDDDGKEKKEEKEKTVDERYRILAPGKLPEQIFREVGEAGALNPDQEKVLLASLTHNGQDLYWAQKKERQKRMKIEQDLVAERAAKQKEIDDLKAQNAELAKLRKKTEEDPLGLVDEDKDEEADPKKKPLTLEDLERIEAEKQEKLEAEHGKRMGRAAEMKEALDYQQEEARERYPDFDVALGHVSAILRSASEGTLDKLYPDPRAQSRIISKARLLLHAFANASQFEPGEFNAADMTYELAKEHPEFGKKLITKATETGETDADGNPEEAKRVVANANRRGSSATLTGGGSRRVALDELTPEQARKIPTKQWNKLPKETRERLLRA